MTSCSWTSGCPASNGIEATRRLTAEASGPKVVMLTTFDLDEYVYDALAAGASGFLLKDVTAEDLIAAVRVVAAGDALIAPAVTRRLIAELARLRAAPAPKTPLDLADPARDRDPAPRGRGPRQRRDRRAG